MTMTPIKNRVFCRNSFNTSDNRQENKPIECNCAGNRNKIRMTMPNDGRF